jgi:hypothetical protein
VLSPGLPHLDSLPFGGAPPDTEVTGSRHGQSVGQTLVDHRTADAQLDGSSLSRLGQPAVTPTGPVTEKEDLRVGPGTSGLSTPGHS